jgi:hypothetical protein
MTDWHCFKDKVQMEEAEVRLSYMQLAQRILGLRCPVCGECYLTEEVVLTTVKEAEDLIYGK